MKGIEESVKEIELFGGVVDLEDSKNLFEDQAPSVCDPCDGCSQSCGGCSSQDYLKRDNLV